MQLNNVNLKELSIEQLQQMDDAVEVFLFSQSGSEPFEDSYKKDPKNFKKFSNEIVSFKRDITGYFQRQYDNRYNLINQYVVKWDEYDDYLYAEQWYKDQEELAAIIESHTTQAFDIGVLALALALGVSFDFGYQEYQRQLLEQARKSAQGITDTTRRRVKTQIQAAMELKENRAQFDARLKSVFMNPYRGRFIAHEEAIDAYMEGKEGLAVNLELKYKKALSAQAKDQMCGRIHGEVTEINKPFSNGKMKPRYHFGCRCDVAYSRTKTGF